MPDTTNYTLELVGILVTLAGLLGLLVRSVLNTNREQANWIRGLVVDAQKNTENFVNTINHQRTKDREMQDRQVLAINNLSENIKVNNEVNARLIQFLQDNGK